jgi:hypothetical protein
MGFWSKLGEEIDKKRERDRQKRLQEEQLSAMRQEEFNMAKAREKGRLQGREEWHDENEARKQWNKTYGTFESRAKNIYGFPNRPSQKKKKNMLDW